MQCNLIFKMSSTQHFQENDRGRDIIWKAVAVASARYSNDALRFFSWGFSGGWGGGGGMSLKIQANVPHGTTLNNLRKVCLLLKNEADRYKLAALFCSSRNKTFQTLQKFKHAFLIRSRKTVLNPVAKVIMKVP